MPEKTNHNDHGNSNRSLRLRVQWVLTVGFLAIAVVVAYPLVLSVVPPQRAQEKDALIEVAPEGSIKEGESRDVLGNDGVPIIVFMASGELRALEKKCPHLGCMVELAEDELDCPCHGARFTLDGKLISGPSPRDLKRYEVVVRDGTIYVGAELR